MNLIKRIRPSNLVIIAALPFIVYLFATSRNYQRSLNAILGIEDGALELLRGFSIFAAILICGLLPALLLLLRGSSPRARKMAILALAIGLSLAGAIALGWIDVSLFASSVIANAVDPFTSTWIIPTVIPRRLTPDALALCFDWLKLWLSLYALVTILLGGGGLWLASRKSEDRFFGRHLLLALGAINFVGLVYLLLGAYLGFAAGLVVTLRAAIFAYLLAALLGLTWAGLLRLKKSRRALVVFAILSAAALAGALYCFTRAETEYSLIGAIDGRVAIVKGTPKSLVDQVRYAQFEGANVAEIDLRTAGTAEEAIALMRAGKDATGALLPSALVPADAVVLWRETALPDRYLTPGFALAILGIVLGLLAFGAYQHGLHPLAVAAEFFIDTMRGIPMLVIILYIGLPLSGALKEASQGAIDLSNMQRGILALAAGYSAYLAEIFRAGIEAVPRGQIEAARSLGLSTWQMARFVILPQALRVVVPPLGNEFIAILKDTALLSILSVRDVTQRMREFQSASFLPFAPYNTVGIFYILLTLMAASGIKWIERRYDAGRH